MARTKITVTDLTRNGAADTAAQGVYQAADAANGMEVAAGTNDSLLLHVKNADAAAHTATIKRGGTQFAPGDAETAVAVAAGGEQLIGPLDSARFQQTDENIYLDFDDDTSVTVAAFRLP